MKKTPKVKDSRVRDLKTGEDWKDPQEFLTIEQHDNQVRLAHWYMRKAGMGADTPIIEREHTWITRLRWFFLGVAIATFYIMASNTFGQ